MSQIDSDHELNNNEINLENKETEIHQNGNVNNVDENEFVPNEYYQRILNENTPTSNTRPKRRVKPPEFYGVGKI